MEVRFRRSYLKRCAENASQATRRWGHPAGNNYVENIRSYQGSATISAIYTNTHTLGLHPLRGNRRGEFAMQIHGRLRLIVEHDEANQTVLIKEVSPTLWRLTSSGVWSNTAIPPGNLLKREIEFRGISRNQLARLMDRTPRRNRRQSSKQKPTSPPSIADDIEKAIGIKAYFWTGLETTYRANPRTQ